MDTVFADLISVKCSSMFTKGAASLITSPLMCLSLHIGNSAEFLLSSLKPKLLSLLLSKSGQLCGSFPVPADPEIVSFVLEDLALGWGLQGRAYDKNL